MQGDVVFARRLQGRNVGSGGDENNVTSTLNLKMFFRGEMEASALRVIDGCRGNGLGLDA